MSTATQVLRHEHEAILKMLDTAESIGESMARNEKIRPEVLSQILEFFRLFADQCHHGKEESLLFPLLEQKGMPRQGGPIGVMLHEHEEGRALMREMSEAVEAHNSGAEGAGARWARAARGYAQLLRSHINKENNILFVMAERVLTNDDQRQLVAQFEKLEVEKMGPGTHERLHAMMDELLSEFPARPASRASKE